MREGKKKVGGGTGYIRRTESCKLLLCNRNFHKECMHPLLKFVNLILPLLFSLYTFISYH